MSIEFPCSQCGKLLRVGDEAAGKQARCPSCGAVQGIPSIQPPATPFGALPPMKTRQLAETNPYQAPVDLAIETPRAPLSNGPRPIQPTIICFSEPIDAIWQMCKENGTLILMCLAAIAVPVAINYASQVVVQGVISVVAQLRPPATLMIFLGVVLGLGHYVFNIWIQIGQTLFFLKTARGEQASLGVLFVGGPYLIATLLATLLFTVVMLFVMGLSAALGFGVYAATKEPIAGVIVGLLPFVICTAYLTLTYGFFFFLIADQGLGPLEALQVSSQITSGNRLTLFALAAIALVSATVSILLCCVPYLVVGPFIVLAATIAYLKMAGQVTADVLWQPQTETPFASQSAELR